MATAAELIVLISAKDAASKVIDGLGKSLGGFGAAGKLAGAAMAGFAVAGAGVAAGLVGAVGAAANFQSGMSAVAAVAGASADQLAQLSATALQLGQDTSLSGIGATDAAAAMRELAAAGVSVDDILGGAARGALLLASAGGIDVARAAEIAANALNQFGLSGNQAGHVADLLAAAANASSADVGDLGESLKFVGPIAKSMGLSIEEVVATLAEFGAQGIKGSQAGTSLRSIISSLADPSLKAKNAIKDLGLQFFDAGGHMKSIAGISEELKVKLGGLTDQQRAQALSTLFGNEALSAATILYGEGADGIAKYLKEVNVAGSAAATGAIRNNNLKGSIEQLKSAWETASITLGAAFLPLIKSLVDQMGLAVNAAIPLIALYGPKFAAALQSGIGRAVAIVQAFGLAVMALFNSLRTGDFSNLFGPLIVAISTAFGTETAGKVTLFVSDLVRNLNLARDAVLTARQAFAGDWVSADSIATPVRIVGELFLRLGEAVRTVQGWIALIPAPVLAAAAAFLALGPALSIAMAVLPPLLGVLTGLGPIVSILTSSLPLLGSVIAALGGPLTIALVAVGALAAAWVTDFMGIQTATMPVITAIQTAITGQLLPALAQLGPFISTNVLPGWVLAWEQMRAATDTAIVAMQPAIERYTGFLRGDLMPALQEIAAVAGPAFAQMGEAVAQAFATARPGLEAFISGVQSLASVVGPIAQQVGAAIIDSLGPAMVALAEWGAVVIPQFADAFEAAMGRLAPIIGAAAEAIGSTLGAIASIVDSHSAQITTVLTAAWTIISETIGTAMTVISTVISAGLQVIAGDWEGALTTLQTGAAAAWDHIDAIILAAISIVTTVVSSAAADWQSLMAAAWAAVLSAVTSAWAQIVGAVQSGVGQILGVLQGLAGQAGAAAAGIGAAIVGGLVGGILAGAGQVASAAAGIVQGALQAARDALQSRSPSKKFIEIGKDAITGFVIGMDAKQDEAIGKAAQIASSVAKAVVDTLAAMKALAGFDFGKNTPSGSAISAVAAFVANTTAIIGEIAAQFKAEALKHTSDFASAANTVVGMIGNAVKALTSLGDFVPPAVSAIYAFGKSLRSLMNDFSLVAEQVTQQAGDAAGKFATAIGPVVDVVGKGLDSFTKLVAWVAPPAAAIYAFGKTLRAAINDFALVAEQVTQEAADAAGKFATAIGPVVDVVGKGVGSFLLLGTYTAPAASAIYEFGKTLRAVINDLALVAEQVTQDAADAAAKFAASAGSVVGIIGPAIDGLSNLAAFVAPSRAAIDNLANAIFETVRRIGELASSMSADGIKAAGEFGTAAGSVFNALKTALDVFTGMAKLVVPSRLAIDQFAIGIAATVAQLGIVADQIGKDGIKKASDFGASIQTVFGSLKTSMDLLTSLAKFKDVASKAFDSLLAGMQEAVQRAQGLVDQAKIIKLQSEEYAALMAQATVNFAKGLGVSGSPQEIGRKLGEGVISGAREAVGAHSPAEELAKLGRDITAGLVLGMTQTQQDAAKAAADLAKGVADAIQATLGAATALGKLDLTTLPTGGQITGLLGFSRALVAEMAASSTMLNEDGIKQTSLFSDAASKVASAVGAGLDALAKLGTFVAPTAARIRDMADAIGAVVADLAIVADRVTMDAATLAGQFAEGASKVLDLVGKGATSFAGVFTFAKPENYKGVYYLHQAIEAAVNDLAEIAARVTVDSSDLAGKFADGAAKVVGLVGAGVAAFKDVFTFAKPENFKGVYYLDQAIEALINDLAEVAQRVTVDSADLAGKFAEGASKAVAILGNGVAGFKALDGFTGVASASLAAFVRATGDLVKQIVGLSTGYAPALLTAAALFADTAGKALGLLGGVANFKALDAFKRPADSSVGAFVATVRDLVKRLVGLGTEFKADMLKAASDFADTGAKSVSLVGAAIGGFGGLATFVTPGRAAVDGLLATVRYIIARFGEMATTMSTEGTKQLGDFGTATNAVLGGVKAAIDTFIALDKAVVPRTGDLSDLVVAVQGVTRNMATAAAALGDDAIKDATAFGTAAQGIFTALKSGLDLFIQIDKPGGWPSTDWLQPLIELMSGVLSRGGLLLSQAQQLKAVADQFNATMAGAYAGFATGIGGGGLTLTGNVGGSGLVGGGGGGTVINNYYTVTGNTLLSKDTGTQQMVSGIVTTAQARTGGYAISG